MNAVASTLISDQPPRVLNASLSEALARVNHAVRQLHEKGWRVTRQELNLGTGKRPLLFIAPGEKPLSLAITQIVQRLEAGAPHVVGKFGDVDVARLAERAS